MGCERLVNDQLEASANSVDYVASMPTAFSCNLPCELPMLVRFVARDTRIPRNGQRD